MNTVIGRLQQEQSGREGAPCKEKSGDVAANANKIKQQMDVLEVVVDAAAGGTKFGTVKMGFSREGRKRTP